MLSIDRLNAQANVEASKHPSMFVSGARPALLWLSVIGIGWQTIFLPVASWAVAIWAPEVELPAINTEGLMTLTLSLLGLGSMRTVEKLKGTARENMRATK